MSGSVCGGCKYYQGCGEPDRVIPCLGYEQAEKPQESRFQEELFLIASDSYIQSLVAELNNKNMTAEYERMAR